MCFLPQDEAAREFAMKQFENFIAQGRPEPARLARRADDQKAWARP
jgi:hypothetical protein